MEHFHALPPELRRQCLLRVPSTSHNTIAAVCKSWEAVVKSPQFYEDRRKLCISQQFICLIEFRTYHDEDYPFAQEFVITVHDPVQGTWEELPRLPGQGTWEEFRRFPRGIPDCFRCVCVNRKLLLIGGRNSNYVERHYSVFIYDFSSAKWSRGRDCPLETVHAACSVSAEGLVYVAGVKEFHGPVYVAGVRAVRGAAVYNVEKDEWKLLPHMNQKWDHCFSTFIDGKFTIIDGDSAPWVKSSKANAEVYDPEKGAWTTLQDVWNGQHPRPFHFPHAIECVGNPLYWFKTREGMNVYDSKANVWRSVASLPQTLRKIACCAAWRDGIFVGVNVEGTYRNDFFRPLPPLRHYAFYMLRPQCIQRGAVASEEMVGERCPIPIRRPQDPHVDYQLLSAVTVEL